MNEDYCEQNSCYCPNSFGFDYPQPPQDSVDHQGILQVLNKMEEKLKEITRDRRKKMENMSIEEIRHEEQLVDYKIKEIINDLGYKRFQGEEIDEEYERDCEIRIRKIKQDFNEWGSEVRKKEKAYEDEKYDAACRYMLSVTCDNDDDDYDDDFYDCVDIEEDGGEIDLDISKIVDIYLREKLVESYLLIEKVNAFSLSPPILISPIICPSSTIPVVDIDLPLEEAEVPSF
ncbi:hypothetical protein Tco_1477639 [Tanacetum coccineum]